MNAVDPWGLDVFYHGNSVNSNMQKHLSKLSKKSGYDIHLVNEGGTRNKPGDSKTSQHYSGNAADFYMKKNNTMLDMADAAHRTADYGGFGGVGYYDGKGPHGAHVHADLRKGAKLYWSETDDTGYKYNKNSKFWNDYFDKENPCP